MAAGVPDRLLNIMVTGNQKTPMMGISRIHWRISYQ